MEIFISQVDARTTKDQLKQSLAPLLQPLQIHVFDVRKRNDKGHAQLTIADPLKAKELLHHASQNPAFLHSPSGKQARFAMSKFPPSPKLIRVLQKEENDMKGKKPWQKSVEHAAYNKNENHGNVVLNSVECGRWEPVNGTVVFTPYYTFSGSGSVTKQKGALIVNMNTSSDKRHELIMELYSIYSIILPEDNMTKTLTITLRLAPKVFEDHRPSLGGLSAGMLELLNELTMELGMKTATTRFRVCSLPESAITGICLVYRLRFEQDVGSIQKYLQRMKLDYYQSTQTSKLSIYKTVVTFADQLSRLDFEVARRSLSFKCKFQIHALWANAVLSPSEIEDMLPAMDALRSSSGEAALIEILSRLVSQLPIVDAASEAQESGSKGAIKAMKQQVEFIPRSLEQRKATRDEVLIHRATVTPTGIYLYGPEAVAANRVLREYRAHHDCFLRVLFADESEERIAYDRDFSNDKIFEGRFLSILSNGLDVAGEHFDFLGFSHSSLRSQTCWFMRPFIHQNKLLKARDLISQLGDFGAIRSPAKCAARIGQAFSESTSAVRVDASAVQTLPDVKFGRYLFTDGCGTISEPIWRSLKANATSRGQPTSYQIRYKGAKGMLTLDTTLKGNQIRLRESMVKFSGSPSNNIEICGTNARPLPYKLNRQIITILEDLNVPLSTFLKLQDQAINKLYLSARSEDAAVDFVRLRLSDSSSGLSALLKHLKDMRIEITEDKFFREILGALLQVELREIKYRSRILVPDALTLYGISDETGWLKEGQVFVTFDSENPKNHSHLNGQIAVTRSPALHPGDIQLAQAVSPPEDSCLWDLHNCIVFSQKGVRDLPSMLSGGDLDGDLYNVIYDSNLMPRKTVTPAGYEPVRPVDIGRIVTADDMTKFFIDFMQNDQLGRIATLHQVLADDAGTSSPDCLLLAELHSTAVDFSKSGVPVDIKKIPKAPLYRPDFMAPSVSTKVEKGIKRGEQAEPEGDHRYRYYESTRILGTLYRAVDEDLFFHDLEMDESSVFTSTSETVLDEILDWVEQRVNPNTFLKYYNFAIEVRNYYESTMLDIMSRCTANRTSYTTEKEVFIGTIIGRSGAGSKYQRERSDHMKSWFNRELRDIKTWTETETAGDDEGFLYASAACLHHAVREQSHVDANINSFGWFAAAMCVPELIRAGRVSVAGSMNWPADPPLRALS